jgi:hypothetical protein
LLEEIMKLKGETGNRKPETGKKVVGFKKLKMVEESKQVAEPEGRYGKLQVHFVVDYLLICFKIYHYMVDDNY